MFEENLAFMSSVTRPEPPSNSEHPLAKNLPAPILVQWAKVGRPRDRHMSHSTEHWISRDLAAAVTFTLLLFAIRLTERTIDCARLTRNSPFAFGSSER